MKKIIIPQNIQKEFEEETNLINFCQSSLFEPVEQFTLIKNIVDISQISLLKDLKIIQNETEKYILEISKMKVETSGLYNLSSNFYNLIIFLTSMFNKGFPEINVILENYLCKINKELNKDLCFFDNIVSLLLTLYNERKKLLDSNKGYELNNKKIDLLHLEIQKLKEKDAYNISLIKKEEAKLVNMLKDNKQLIVVIENTTETIKKINNVLNIEFKQLFEEVIARCFQNRVRLVQIFYTIACFKEKFVKEILYNVDYLEKCINNFDILLNIKVNENTCTIEDNVINTNISNATESDLSISCTYNNSNVNLNKKYLKLQDLSFLLSAINMQFDNIIDYTQIISVKKSFIKYYESICTGMLYRRKIVKYFMNNIIKLSNLLSKMIQLHDKEVDKAANNTIHPISISNEINKCWELITENMIKKDSYLKVISENVSNKFSGKLNINNNQYKNSIYSFENKFTVINKDLNKLSTKLNSVIDLKEKKTLLKIEKIKTNASNIDKIEKEEQDALENLKIISKTLMDKLNEGISLFNIDGKQAFKQEKLILTEFLDDFKYIKNSYKTILQFIVSDSETVKHITQNYDFISDITKSFLSMIEKYHINKNIIEKIFVKMIKQKSFEEEKAFFKNLTFSDENTLKINFVNDLSNNSPFKKTNDNNSSFSNIHKNSVLNCDFVKENKSSNENHIKDYINSSNKMSLINKNKRISCLNNYINTKNSLIIQTKNYLNHSTAMKDTLSNNTENNILDLHKMPTAYFCKEESSKVNIIKNTNSTNNNKISEDLVLTINDLNEKEIQTLRLKNNEESKNSLMLKKLHLKNDVVKTCDFKSKNIDIHESNEDSAFNTNKFNSENNQADNSNNLNSDINKCNFKVKSDLDDVDDTKQQYTFKENKNKLLYDKKINSLDNINIDPNFFEFENNENNYYIDKDEDSFSEEDNQNIQFLTNNNVPLDFKKPKIKDKSLKVYFDRIGTFRHENLSCKNKKLSNEENKINDISSIKTKSKDDVIDSFNCAYFNKLLLQGTMYVKKNLIVFKSYFNPKTFLGTTKLCIPLNDIKSVEKTHFGIFDNSIAIITDKQKLFFTSYVSRDKCFYCLQNLLNKEKNMLNEENDEHNNNNTSSNINNTMINKTMENKVTKEDINKYLYNIFNSLNINSRLSEINNERILNHFNLKENQDFYFKPVDFFSDKIIDNQLISKLPLSSVYNGIYNFKNINEYFEKNETFYKSFYIDRGDKNIEFKNSTLEENKCDNSIYTSLECVPSFFEDESSALSIFSVLNKKQIDELLDSSFNWKNKLFYSYTYIHPIEKKMVGPSELNMKEEFHISFVSPSLMIVEMRTYGIDFIYSDCFVTYCQYRYNTEYNFNVEKGQVEFKTYVSVYFKVNFVKSCVFSSVITKEGVKEANKNTKYGTIVKIENALDSLNDNVLSYYDSLVNDSKRKHNKKFLMSKLSSSKIIEESTKDTLNNSKILGIKNNSNANEVSNKANVEKILNTNTQFNKGNKKFNLKNFTELIANNILITVILILITILIIFICYKFSYQVLFSDLLYKLITTIIILILVYKLYMKN